MKSFITTAIFASFLFAVPSISVANPTQAFGTCLIDNLNGKERKDLIKWIFFAIAAHPEINSFSKVTSDDSLKNDKVIGGLITRLLTENCPAEMKAANDADPQAIQTAFKLVGEVAMQELMTNKLVSNSISNYVNHADQKKIAEVLTK